MIELKSVLDYFMATVGIGAIVGMVVIYWKYFRTPRSSKEKE